MVLIVLLVLAALVSVASSILHRDWQYLALAIVFFVQAFAKWREA